MVRDGIWYALGSVAAAALVFWITQPWLAVLPLVLAAFFLWFFRDPEREVPAVAGAVVSPADGKVTHVGTEPAEGGPRTRISIFLSIFDVHVNRSPIAGVVKKVEYRKGSFGNAMSGESSLRNEQNLVTVEGEGVCVSFKQIAGLLARRIVFTKAVGDPVGRGERVGLIKFGSRVDLLLPSSCEVKVKVGEHVRGGASLLAVCPGETRA